MKKSAKQWLFWTPRVLAMLFAAFVSIFALDVFGAGALAQSQATAIIFARISSVLQRHSPLSTMALGLSSSHSSCRRSS